MITPQVWFRGLHLSCWSSGYYVNLVSSTLTEHWSMMHCKTSTSEFHYFIGLHVCLKFTLCCKMTPWLRVFDACLPKKLLGGSFFVLWIIFLHHCFATLKITNEVEYVCNFILPLFHKPATFYVFEVIFSCGNYVHTLLKVVSYIYIYICTLLKPRFLHIFKTYSSIIFTGNSKIKRRSHTHLCIF